MSPTPSLLESQPQHTKPYRTREISAIEETLRQTWPRTNGQDLGEAHVWLANGFEDSEAVAWLEVGVFRPITARFLQLERIEPRKLVSEVVLRACDCHLSPRPRAGELPAPECTKCHGSGEESTTLGYAFCAGLCSFKTVKRTMEGTL